MPATRVDLNERGQLPEPSWGTTTERRREIVVAALPRNAKRNAQQHTTVGELLRELTVIYEAGGWPPAPRGYGRDDPYSGGLTQHLTQLLSKGRVERIDVDNTYRWRASPGRPKLVCPLCGGKRPPGAVCCQPCREGRAESLLPAPDFVDIIRDYQHRTGLEVIFGVTHDFERVIRIGMPRGILEHVLGPQDAWDEAVEEMELR